MKCLFTTILTLFVFSLSATVHTVDNSNNSVAQFTDLQSAIDAASEGDTLMIKGSYIPYSPQGVFGSLDNFTQGIRLNKRLVLIGEGAIGHPNGPDFEDWRQKTFIPRIFFTTDNGASASGSVMIGVFAERIVMGDINTTAELITDIELRDCQFESLRFGEEDDEVDGITFIRSNIFMSTFIYARLKNLVAKNCFVEISGDSRATAGTSEFVNCLIRPWPSGDRTVYGQDNDGNDLYEREWPIENIKISNSVILLFRSNPDIPERVILKASNAEMRNNIVMGPFETQDLLESGNVAPIISNMSIELDPFVKTPPTESSTFFATSFNNPIRSLTSIGDYHLKSGSVGVANGTDGTDIGLYGGDTPWIDGPVWRYSNEPQIPTIQSLQLADKVVKPGEGLKVRVKATAKGN